ncbi:hypothetical protein M406DRAFT_285677 [Cryphonectria parasitica EP155]|uniref:Rhomboid family membrane protein n=1 Tax=Cryphonectria parasitica (strain ATCC 38755 / EP155) TaxID=660469 RepID=A0A9P4YDI1_CRYP1|nr:uncharacterized protein M406DRAFT_285677 [Cryphonectria parasitica EP155]KAF3770877.1 hypothetical protein M406DRAFT_285677 [Cryphonectria parasitica EP155]
MTTPQAQPPPSEPCPPPQQQPPNPVAPGSGTKFRNPDWVHYSAWAGVILGPIALFMPPRRVGLQSLFLASGTSYATNILAYDYTGESIYQRFVRRWSNMVDGGLPEKARRTQELLRIERERKEAALSEAQRKALQEEREKKEMAQRGPLARLWMGSEKENWKEERAKKEKEALEEGKGYGDLIMEQVKEAFGMGEKDDSGEDKKSGKPEDDRKP